MNLKKNAFWSIFGNLVYAVAQWGVLIILAKLAGPKDVGQFTLGLAVVAPVFMLSNLQLRSLQATDAKEKHKFNEYLGLRIATSMLSILAITIYALFQKNDSAWVIAVIGVAKSFEAVSDIVYGLLQKQENSAKIAFSLVLKGVFSVFSIGTIYYVSQNLLLATLALAASWLIILLFVDLRFAKEATSINPKFDLSNLKSIIKVAFPLGVTMMLISLQTNVTRYFLEHYTDEFTLGIFGALSYVVVVGSIAINSIGQAVSPRMAKHWSMNEIASFLKILRPLLLLAFSMGAVSILLTALFGVFFVTKIYSEEFAKSNDVLIVLMIGASLFFISSVVGYAMTAARIIKIQPFFFLGVAIVAFLSSWLLIPSLGIMGAALATVCTSVTQLIGSSYILYSVIRKSR